MINGPTSGTIAVVLDTIVQLFNAGSSAIGNSNSPGDAATDPGTAAGGAGVRGVGG